MILHLPADAPLAARLAADAALFLHIAGGTIGLVSGGIAMAAPKGRRIHRWAGTVFVGAMMVMAAIGGFVAALFPHRLSVVMGLLTLYLVGTGWMTIRRRRAPFGPFDWAATAVAAGAAIANVTFGLIALHRPHQALDGIPAAPHFIFAGVAALAAGSDIWVYLRRGVAGGQRIARHVWRMSVALLIGATSLFQGQDQVFPKAIRGTFVLIAPDIAIVVLMVFWLGRSYLRRSATRLQAEPAV